MERRVRRVENDRVIEQWRHTANALLHVLVPELDSATPLWLPALIEVEDQVAAAPPVRFMVMVAKVCMNVEEAAAFGLVHAAAFQTWVGHQPLNPG